MEKLICNSRRGKARTSRFAWFVALVRKVATSATLPAVLALAVTALGDGLPTGYTQVPYIRANGNCQAADSRERQPGPLVFARQ